MLDHIGCPFTYFDATNINVILLEVIVCFLERWEYLEISHELSAMTPKETESLSYFEFALLLRAALLANQEHLLEIECRGIPNDGAYIFGLGDIVE
jgi:hypothetical protein